MGEPVNIEQTYGINCSMRTCNRHPKYRLIKAWMDEDAFSCQGHLGVIINHITELFFDRTVKVRLK